MYISISNRKKDKLTEEATSKEVIGLEENLEAALLYTDLK
jgi:hypothetical protein